MYKDMCIKKRVDLALVEDKQKMIKKDERGVYICIRIILQIFKFILEKE
jgi:hypothetical protein